MTRAAAIGATVACVLAVGGAAAVAQTIHRPHATGPQHLNPRAAALAAPPPLTTEILRADPALYWPLNGGGAPAPDQSGHGGTPLRVTGTGPNLTWHAPSAPVGAGPGGSVRFSPASDTSGRYLTSDVQPLAATPNDGAVVIWFHLAAPLPGWRQTLLADNGGNDRAVLVDKTGRLALGARIYNPDSLQHEVLPGFATVQFLTGALNDGKWHCVVVNDLEPKFELYLDGQLLYSEQTAGFQPIVTTLAYRAASLVAGDAGVDRGGPARTGRFDGNLSNVAIFTHTLTSGEVSSIWDAGAGVGG